MYTVCRSLANIEELKYTEAEKEKVCLVSEIQAVIAKKSAEIIVNSLFNNFNQGFVDMGNTVVNQSSFLNKKTVFAGLVNNISKNL